MVDNTSSKEGLNRRNLLKAVGVTGAAMTGFSGVSGAALDEDASVKGVPTTHLGQVDSEEIRAYQKYVGDKAMMEGAFDEHIDSIVQVMESSSASAPSALEEAKDIDVVPDRKSGTASAHIVAKFENQEELVLHIYPQADRAYAIVGSGPQKKLFDPVEGVEPMGCYYEYECNQNGCSMSLSHEITWECCHFTDGSEWCEYRSGHCGCEYSSV